MKTEIENALAVLVGKSLWDCSRAADLASFSFGERKTVKDSRGNSREVGEYALHLQCAWRITQLDKMFVGSGDVYFSADDNQEWSRDFNWDRIGANRRDKLIALLFGGRKKQFAVTQIAVRSAASFQIILEEGFALEVFPSDSHAKEYWRFFRPYVDEPHFVVTAKGIET